MDSADIQLMLEHLITKQLSPVWKNIRELEARQLESLSRLEAHMSWVKGLLTALLVGVLVLIATLAVGIAVP